jgi:hypothetical protein
MPAKKRKTPPKKTPKKKSVARAKARTSAAKNEMVYVPIDSVQLWDRNPKKHSDASIKRLASLIEVHGFVTPLTIWKESPGYILKGNGSYGAASLLGLDSVPVIYKSFPNAEAAFDYATADNVANEWSEWDEVKLAEEYARRDIVDPKKLERVSASSGFSVQEIQGLTEGWIESDETSQPKPKQKCTCPKCGHRFVPTRK